MTIVITMEDNPGNYIYVDVNADFATLFWKFVAMATFWKLRLANFNSLIERLSNAR